MNVGVVGEVLAPGVEHGQVADLGSEVARVCGNPAQGLSGRAEENVVDDTLVLESDGRDGVRDGENDMEVFHRQELSFALLEPAFAGQ